MSTRYPLEKYREVSKSLSHRSYIPLSNASEGSSSFSARFSRRSLAAIAIEKTSSALSSLASLSSSSPSDSPLRSTSSSSGGLSRSRSNAGKLVDPNSTSGPGASRGGGSDPYINGYENSNNYPPYRIPESESTDTLEFLPQSPSFEPSRPPSNRRHTIQGGSRPTSSLDTSMSTAKMHQTSSRLLRMTADDRPFTRDFKDLFATLMVSLKLETHRVRFTKFDHTFTAEEAIMNLGSLKFSQSNRMPDPKDPSRIVTTTTTTTFSMAKEMARNVCQRFVDARFIEPVDGRTTSQFPLKGALYQMTPKGINILQRFCQRNGITARHIMDVLDSPRNTMQLVILERDSATDQISHDRATIEVIFRRFAGQDGPNIKNSVSSSDSDSVSEYTNGLVGVKMARERKVGDKTFQNSFTGKAAVDWLMDCCSTVDRRECIQLVEQFVKQGLIASLLEDKAYMQQEPSATLFQPTKYALYKITEHGQRVCGWIAREKPAASQYDPPRVLPRDSNHARLTHILQDPALRLLFREFLRYSLCEENLSFYLDVSEFTENYHRQEKAGAFQKMEAVRETLASAYGLYNAFLAPGSPCELNIEHALRNSLASRMTRAVGDDASMLKSLQEVVSLFEMAQVSVFKLMSSDSIPKFIRDPKYAQILQEHDLDINASGRSYSPTPAPVPERSMSRSNRS